MTLSELKLWQRESYLQRTYDISSEDYEKKLKEQKGVCAICGRPPKKRRLAVDHNHKTGEIRGLLCYICNRLILGRIERFKIPIAGLSAYIRKYSI